MKKEYLTTALIIIFVIGVFMLSKTLTMKNEISKDVSPVLLTEPISYIPLGDSYSIGLGVAEQERWPNIITNQLQSEGVEINLLQNPAVSGYTVADAFNITLPIIKKENPTLITVLIGANDSFQQKNSQVFAKEYKSLLDGLAETSATIVLLTIPNYANSPAASASGAGTSQVVLQEEIIKSYNKIIEEEGLKRNLHVIDLFPISNQMNDKSYYIDDGLHPSAKGYTLWSKTILQSLHQLIGK